MFDGARLRKLRKEHGLTMRDFGAKFSLAESTISGYENGSRKPDLETIDKFASFFDVSVDYLMGRTIVPSVPSETNLSFFGGPDKYTPDEIEEMEAALERYREMKRRAAQQVNRNK
ncbi:helix-turn-helix transcriptional regulator [Paenibacillus sp. VCA1]|uniref:helix-turn-helix domain-containing protein n=1 Tax=Paenibacillus sp. VCA1 TaxID=3039148 RepID=UPI00287246C4|nr:helix-turn-helix transcriptional regulator [Paenibacillus sp. VCA1]MDR9857837.1 helix-turn-helix transcriptional regulator [Paenibacillus sp. VCA1]